MTDYGTFAELQNSPAFLLPQRPPTTTVFTSESALETPFGRWQIARPSNMLTLRLYLQYRADCGTHLACATKRQASLEERLGHYCSREPNLQKTGGKSLRDGSSNQRFVIPGPGEKAPRSAHERRYGIGDRYHVTKNDESVSRDPKAERQGRQRDRDRWRRWKITTYT